jgi:hypothetical protein
MRTPHEEKHHRSRARAKQALKGVVLAAAIFGALEVGLRVVADGHPNESVRMVAMAVSVAAGYLAGALRSA